MLFEQFKAELGGRDTAEGTLKKLWAAGLVAPTNTEIDPEDGALFEIRMPSISEPIKDSSQFVLTKIGYESVEPIYIHNSLKNCSSTDGSNTQVPQQIVISTQFINAKLMEELTKKPELMQSLTPRQFEEFVAELFFKEGFNVELTPERKDGGRDVIAVSHNELGTHLYIAECKRYSSNNPVGVEYVRSLYGVLEAERATHGIIATTSHFTKGAKDLSRDLKWRIGLKDYKSLIGWVNKLTCENDFV